MVLPCGIVALHCVQNTRSIMAANDVNELPMSHCTDAPSSGRHWSFCTPSLTNLLKAIIAKLRHNLALTKMVLPTFNQFCTHV